ncbi:hypothetical protein OG735_31820 [Streptomyces sp. NBC_01210]|nr:hypothetical protein OG735_31820 [Streptomyces sp. NBC_01210]
MHQIHLLGVEQPQQVRTLEERDGLGSRSRRVEVGMRRASGGPD